MKLFRFLLFSIFCGAGSIQAQNLIFNPSFESGCDGFALLRTLRPDTNPTLKFRPLESVVCNAPDGTRALRIANPHAEDFQLHSREYFLKKDTVYIFRARMKSSTPDFPLYVNQLQWEWLPVRFPEVFHLSTDWREYEYRFDTGKHEGYFHLEMRHARNAPPAGEIWIDKLELFEAFTEPEGNMEFSVETPAPLRNRGEKISFTVKAANCTPRAFQGKITALAREEFTKEILFSADFDLQLKPGERKSRTFSFTGSRNGSYFLDIKVPGKCEVLPGTVAVIDVYKPEPIHPAKDFCVGINHGLMLQWNTANGVKGYQVCNAPFLTDFELLSRMGCRLIREHDGGYDTFSWAILEPGNNRWDDSWYERSLSVYKKFHMEPLAVVGRQNFVRPENWEGIHWPLWLIPRLRKLENLPDYTRQYIRDRIYLPPENFWRRYVSHIAKLGKGRVRLYEIFNEPNRALPADEYLAFVRSAAEEIRKADPDATVIGGSVTSDFNTPTDQFTREFVQNGGKDCVDALSFHPYQGRELGSPTPADVYIANFRKTAQNKTRELPIWNTELYYLHETKDSSLRQSFLSPDRAASRFLLDLGENCRQSVAVHSNSLWHLRLTPHTWHRQVGRLEYRPNGVFVAYNALARLFEGAKPIGKEKLPLSNICYTYQRNGAPIAAIWNWMDRKDSGMDLSGFRVLDCYGNEIDSREIVALTSAPVYILPGKVSSADFFTVLKKRRPFLRMPVSAGNGCRTADGSLFFMLRNNSDRPETVQYHLSDLQKGTQSVSLKGGETRVCSVKLPSGTVLPEEVELILKKGNVTLSSRLRVFHATVAPLQTRIPVGPNASVRFQKQNGELTVQIDVADSTDSGSGGSRKPWEQDCVELFLDGEPLDFSRPRPTAYHDNCARAFLMPRQKSNGVTLWFGKSEFRFLSFAKENRKDGYTVLFTVKLPEKTLRQGYVGIDLKIDNAPLSGGPGTVQETVWSEAGNEILANRMVFPLVRLNGREH